MKRLNRKGFTLVELLAVIIILAIVVGITIPAVLTTTSKAKAKAFKTAAQTSADWIDRQVQIQNNGLVENEMATLDPSFEDAMEAYDDENGLTLDTTDSGSFGTMSKKFIYAAGLNPNNISKLYFKISSGRACVKLTATSNGDYAGVGTGTNNNEMEGGAC